MCGLDSGSFSSRPDVPFDSNTVLVPNSLDDIAEALAERVLAQVRSEYPEIARRSRLGPFMSDKKSTEETGLTKRQLRHLRATNRIDYVKRGRVVLNDTASLFAYLDEGRVRAREN